MEGNSTGAQQASGRGTKGRTTQKLTLKIAKKLLSYTLNLLFSLGGGAGQQGREKTSTKKPVLGGKKRRKKKLAVVGEKLRA